VLCEILVISSYYVSIAFDLVNTIDSLMVLLLALVIVALGTTPTTTRTMLPSSHGTFALGFAFWPLIYFYIASLHFFKPKGIES
jgi:hypothetical protein